MDNRNIRKEESAVSPVIGVILMVAITVILAA
ncbi:MAG TPA: type IV pilin, partial [Methanosarcinales archaeon]|nr:type IV pilin [Methanosarcinales archaeon]